MMAQLGSSCSYRVVVSDCTALTDQHSKVKENDGVAIQCSSTRNSGVQLWKRYAIEHLKLVTLVI